MTARRRPVPLLAGLVGTLLLGVAVLVGCSPASSGPPAAGGSAAGGEGASLPCPAQPATPAAGAHRLPTLSFACLGGGTFDLGRAPGVPTVVNLWASWCGPCREELPLMQQLAAAAGDRVRVVGVVSKDGRDQATSFAADAGAHFPSAFDGEGELMTDLGLNGLPYTYLLDADGGIAYTQVGPVTSYDELVALVDQHLGKRL
jgi:cytochrome c biogenesis protein CcmG, thiol:disulfide interchange protein DsbE